MDDTQIIADYEEMLTVTQQMVEAARGSDWDQLAALEQRCKSLIECLVAAGPHAAPGGPLQQYQAGIMHMAPANDEEAGNIAAPSMQTMLVVADAVSSD